ncbi:putative baseplate hub subunit and tail lysozyme [Microcystis phage Mwe-JY25]
MVAPTPAPSPPPPAAAAPASSVKNIQWRLAQLGFDPGPSDGKWGPRTEAAVRQFQRARGLAADGIVGPRTRLALWPMLVEFQVERSTPVRPLWLTHAIAEIGVAETSGRDSNGRILAYRTMGRTTDDAATEDGARPWCADFANAMLESAGVPGTRSGMARSFERHPEFVRLDGPALGAVITYWRGSKASGKGHVNFYAGRRGNGRMVGVGGNQGDAVTAAEYGASRLVGFWWPRSAPLPAIGHIPPVIRPSALEGRET